MKTESTFGVTLRNRTVKLFGKVPQLEVIGRQVV